MNTGSFCVSKPTGANLKGISSGLNEYLINRNEPNKHIFKVSVDHRNFVLMSYA